MNIFTKVRFTVLVLLSFLCLFFAFEIKAQEQQRPAIQISKLSQSLNGKMYHVHIVEHGQTLFSIARAYSSDYRNAIIKTDIDKLSIGDTVWIPFLNSEKENEILYSYYEVQQGETLYGISKKNNLKEVDIIAINPNLSATTLQAGQIIKIPASKDSVKISPSRQIQSVTVVKNDEVVKEENVITTKESSLVINDLRDKSTVCIALLMPFNLSAASEISLSKLEIEQKRKRNYKSFEFIQFYEGALLAIDKLQKKGYPVRLYVYDVGENNSETVRQIFEKPEMKEVDLVVALLFQKAFETAANLAKEKNVFIINPLSNRFSILENNPYVFKIFPSTESYAANSLSLISKTFTNPNIFLIHSDKPSESEQFKAFKAAFEAQKTIPYTLYSWSAISSISTHMKADKNNIIISIYNEKGKNSPAFVTSLLNRLVSLKTRPTLFGPNDWLEFDNVDFTYLQRLNYHFENNLYLDLTNPVHKEFIDLYKETYKTEPNGQLSGVAYDIFLHFVTGLSLKGKSFWSEPNLQSGQANLLNPFFFKRKDNNHGFENSRNTFYKLQDYQIVPALKKTH